MDQSVASHSSSRTYWTTEDIRHKIEHSKVVVFSKGTIENPRCGFSKQALNAIDDCGTPFEVVDVCTDSSIVAALRTYAGRKSLPLIYVEGALVSSSEELEKMVQSGELRARVTAAFGKDRV